MGVVPTVLSQWTFLLEESLGAFLAVVKEAALFFFEQAIGFS